MADTPTRDAKLVQFLNEAYAKERQLETALEAHVEMTTHDDYARRLQDHLKETKSHATQVSRRIKQLGGNPETVSIPGPDGIGRMAQSLSGTIGKAKAAAQGPLHTIRGSGYTMRSCGRGASCACAGEAVAAQSATAAHSRTPTQHHERYRIIVVLFLARVPCPACARASLHRQNREVHVLRH